MSLLPLVTIIVVPLLPFLPAWYFSSWSKPADGMLENIIKPSHFFSGPALWLSCFSIYAKQSTDVVSRLLEHFDAEPDHNIPAGRMDSFPERLDQHLEETKHVQIK